MLRNAPAWRGLPAEFGPWMTVYQYFRRFALDGFFDFVLSGLCCAQGAEVLFPDSTHLKVHQRAANGTGSREFEAIGKSRGGLNTKLHVLVDGLGRLAACLFTSGQIPDVTAAPALIDPMENAVIAGDKPFDPDEFISHLKRRDREPCIPSRSNPKIPRPCNQWFYRARHIVKNFFQRLKIYRRCATRYEKTLILISAFATLAFPAIYDQ